MRGAGGRNTRIEFQRATVEQDAAGEERRTWVRYAEMLAKVIFGRGSERRQAAMEQGLQSVTFQVLSDPKSRALQLTDRVLMAGAVWDIAGVSIDTPGIGLVEVTATRTGQGAASEAGV